jgi:hypothetical protein
MEEVLAALLVREELRDDLATGGSRLQAEFGIGPKEIQSLRNVSPAALAFVSAEVAERRWQVLDVLPLTQQICGDWEGGDLRRAFLRNRAPTATAGEPFKRNQRGKGRWWVLRRADEFVEWLADAGVPAGLLSLASCELTILRLAEDSDASTAARRTAREQHKKDNDRWRAQPLSVSRAVRYCHFDCDVLAAIEAYHCNGTVLMPEPSPVRVLMQKTWPEWRPRVYQVTPLLLELLRKCDGKRTADDVVGSFAADLRDQVGPAVNHLLDTGVLTRENWTWA